MFIKEKPLKTQKKVKGVRNNVLNHNLFLDIAKFADFR